MSDWRPYKVGTLNQVLMPRDVDILESLERYRLLDARLIQELHFPVGSGGHLTVSAATRAANRVITRLESHRLIARLGRRIGGPTYGSSSTVWQLAAAGDLLLRARRGDRKRRRYIEPSPGFLDHTLDVARLVSKATTASRSGAFDLMTIEAEPICWRRFQGAEGAEILKPDLYLVTADVETETHSFVEVDRGTEHLPAVLRKCRIYQRYWQSGAEQAALELFPAVVWITTDERRAARIQEAIAADRDLTTGLFRTTTQDGALALLAPTNPSLSKGGTS